VTTHRFYKLLLKSFLLCLPLLSLLSYTFTTPPPYKTGQYAPVKSQVRLRNGRFPSVFKPTTDNALGQLPFGDCHTSTGKGGCPFSHASPKTSPAFLFSPGKVPLYSPSSHFRIFPHNKLFLHERGHAPLPSDIYQNRAAFQALLSFTSSYSLILQNPL